MNLKSLRKEKKVQRETSISSGLLYQSQELERGQGRRLKWCWGLRADGWRGKKPSSYDNCLDNYSSRKVICYKKNSHGI